MSNETTISDFTARYLAGNPLSTDKIELGYRGQPDFVRNMLPYAHIAGLPPGSVQVALRSKTGLFKDAHLFTLMVTADALYFGIPGVENVISLGDIKSIQVLPRLAFLAVNGRAYPMTATNSGFEEYNVYTCHWLNSYFQALIDSCQGREFPPVPQRVKGHGPFYGLIQNYMAQYPSPFEDGVSTELLVELAGYYGPDTPPLHDILMAFKSSDAIWVLTGSAMYFDNRLCVPLHELQSISFEKVGVWPEYSPVINGMGRRENTNVPLSMMFPDTKGPAYIQNLTAYLVANKHLAQPGEVMPASPVQPAAPASPVRSAVPASPVRSAVPASPVRSAVPAAPVQPASPAFPVHSARRSLQAGAASAAEEHTAGSAVTSWGCLFVIIAILLAALVSTGSDMSFGQGFVTIFLVLVGIGIYCLPSIIAFEVKHPMRWPILGVNILLGSTVLGWLAALVWSFVGREKK